jgi:hypothetical protein
MLFQAAFILQTSFSQGSSKAVKGKPAVPLQVLLSWED